MKKLFIIIFAAILVLGFILRFYDLGKVPDSLSWDEVSWGYNAFSIFETGRDEHNKLLPMSFEAFGDFKQPVYVYLASLVVGIFGPDNFTVRFPSALLGTLSIPFVWLLVFELFRKEKNRNILALCTMFFFAVSPWSIQFSRVAYEANIGLFFVISGVSLFLLGLNSKKYWICYLSIILLSISGYSYHSNKIFTPILFVGLLLFSHFSFKIPKKYLLIFITIFVIGNLFWVIDTRTTARGRSVTFLSNQTPILETSARELIYDNRRGDQLGELLHNRRIVYANRYFENYLYHFNPNYLFIFGDNARHHAFGLGVLYLVSLPLVCIGIFKLDKRKYWLVPFWLLVAPLASSLAVDAPNASRSLVSLPAWQIFEAIGLVHLISISKGLKRNVVIGVAFLLIFINFFYWAHNYFNHTNSEYGIYWQQGYKEAMEEASKHEKLGKSVAVSQKFEQAYIFYLFYTKFDPKKYLSSGGSERIKERCFAIGMVNFGDCRHMLAKGTIFISPDHATSEDYKKISDISNSQGKKVGEVSEYLK